MKKRNYITILVGILVGILLLGIYHAYETNKTTGAPALSQNVSATFTLSQLAQFDGTDPAKPIYIGLNGFVYDVTAGKSFYEKGGSYNWLAGKDSSKDLNLIGGDIIKRKYPVIGMLVQ